MILFLNLSLFIICLFYSGYELVKLLRKTTNNFYKTFFILVALGHFTTSFGVSYYLDMLTTLHDPHDFYIRAQEATSWIGTFGLGHRFMSFIIYPFVHVGIKIEVLFVLFASISFKGFLIYFELLKVHEFKKKSKVFLLLFFLIPSIHFWTSFLGKDPLLFFLMALVLKRIYHQNFDYKIGLLLVPIFLVRPHVCLVLIFSLVLFFLLNKNISNRFKQRILLGFIASIVVLIPIFFLFFLKMENLNTAAFMQYYHSFIDYTVNKGNTSINLSETTIFSRIGYLLFMPLPFLYPFKNYFIVLISIENLYYLVVLGYVFQQSIKNWRKRIALNSVSMFALIASFFLIVLFGSYLYNLGLGNRMRIMFYPYLFYFLISTVNFNKKILVN